MYSYSMMYIRLYGSYLLMKWTIFQFGDREVLEKGLLNEYSHF